jgi:tetratricopeptide (TPR) repeat protein
MNEWFEAEQRIERAQELTESQRWAEALGELEAALAINPNVAAWHAQRGYLLEELDRPTDAVASYERALELEPGDPDVAVALGVALARLGRHARALEVLEDIARTYPDFEPAYCHRIGIYAQLGRHDQAEEMFYLAQELEDSCPHCFFQIGVSLAIRGQTDRAIYCWQRVLELDPTYVGVYRRIAQAHRARGELDRAREYFLREIREDPGNTDLLFELAELTLESGDLATAGAKFAHILDLDPSDVEARFALGNVWLMRGKPEEALICFERVESVTGAEPELPEFELKVGEALFRLGRFAEAAPHLEVAAQEDPRSPQVLMLLGGCLLGGEKLDGATDCFRRVLALDSRNPFAHHSLGVCLFQTGRHEPGLNHCLEAIRLKPDFGVALYNAAVAYLRLAKWAEARGMLRRALRSDPENESLQQLSKRIWRYRLTHFLRRFRGWLRALFGLSGR